MEDEMKPLRVTLTHVYFAVNIVNISTHRQKHRRTNKGTRPHKTTTGTTH